MTAWMYLIIAGILEIGWPVGLKLAQEPSSRMTGVAIAVAFMFTSGVFLWLAQKSIPLGTSYAVCSGIGAAGTFLVGILFFGDSANFGRFLGVFLIVAGVATLKLAS